MIWLAVTSMLVWVSAHAAPGDSKTTRSGALVPPKAPAKTPTSVPAFKGDAIAGKEKAEAERCFECHGADGNGQGHANGPEGKFAKLAGQYPGYLLKQMQDLRSGARKHDQMAIMARSVADEDLADILAYFAGLPRMKGEGGGSHDAARKLFQKGDPARGIVSCASCHGDDGKGLVEAKGPIVGGQEWKYLEKQLLDWRSGFRRNSSDGVMNKSLQALTDAEVQALADYLAAQ